MSVLSQPAEGDRTAPPASPASAIDFAGGSLSPTHLAALTAALRSSALDAPHPLISDLRQRADRAVLDTCMWAMVDKWLNGHPRPPLDEWWPLVGAGLLGGDHCATGLSDRIPKWVGNRYHKRALFSLEVLSAIGTDTSLMLIDALARKIRKPSFRQRGAEVLEKLAKRRGLSRDEIDDMVVPDCGLDARGRRVFDYGPRQFHFVMRPGPKAAVKDPDGKIRENLPPPRQSDDAALAARALAEWKLLKKQVKQAVRLQTLRLEQVMVTGRRWTAAQFRQRLLDHPLMIHLVRELIWGQYEADGRLTATFRVAEDATCIDIHDRRHALDDNAHVGIVHPLAMDEPSRSAWGIALADYEIVPPFEQMARPVYRLLEQESALDELTRFSGTSIPAASVVGTLDRMGWLRGVPGDGGMFFEHAKYFQAADLTAVVEYDGICIVGWQVGDPVRLVRCFFVPGNYKPVYYPKHATRVRLREVNVVVISEVLKELSFVASKGK